MENYPIRSVTFGGFDKQDVIRYIEQTAQGAAAAQKELQDANAHLEAQLQELTEEAASLRAQLAALTGEKTAAETALRAQNDALTAELEAIRPDAASYAQFRERIGAIECEARERANALENATKAQLAQTVESFRSQYQVLMSTFETTSAHVNSELRKVEVNLTQLPRAMDRSAAELNALSELLKASENA